MNTEEHLDATDKRILEYTMKNGYTNLGEIATELGVSKSTVHNRIKRMREIDLLRGFFPLINQDKIRDTVTAFSLVRAKYGPDYAKDIGAELAKIPGVWAAYYVMGDNDFLLLIRVKRIDDLSGVIDSISKVEGVERSGTLIAMNIFKENQMESVRLD